LRNSRLMNQPFEEVLAKTRRMCDRQANVLIQVEELDATPIDARRTRQSFQEFHLGSTGGCHDARQALVTNHGAERLRGMLGRRYAQGMFVPKNLDLQFSAPLFFNGFFQRRTRAARKNCKTTLACLNFQKNLEQKRTALVRAFALPVPSFDLGMQSFL
jgi:hypothetical protein